MPDCTVLELLGAPDYVDRNRNGFYYFRYDIDKTAAPYTLLVWLKKKGNYGGTWKQWP
jgi:hypothetical protein